MDLLALSIPRTVFLSLFSMIALEHKPEMSEGKSEFARFWSR